MNLKSHERFDRRPPLRALFGWWAALFVCGTIPLGAQNTAPAPIRGEVNLAELARQQAKARLTAGDSVGPARIAPLMNLTGESEPGRTVSREVAGAPGESSGTGVRSFQSASPAPDQNFEALGDNNTSIPPDTMGAVGPNHLMVTLNSEVRVQDRLGTPLLTLPLFSFWSTVMGGSFDVFDPKVLYDPYAARWMTTACADRSSTNSAVLIGVSATSDPTGNWFLYRVDADTNDLTWADYPGFGFNKNWIVVTKNMFDIAGAGAFNRTHVYIFNKTNLYAGGVTAAHTLVTDSSVFTLMPAATYDDTTDLLYLVSNQTGNDGQGNGVLRLFRISGTVGVETMNEITTVSDPNPWNDSPFVGNADFAPQLGTVQRVMNNDSRILNTVFRNGSIWCAQTVFLPVGLATRSAAQWWQINAGSGTVIQRGRVDDPTGNRYFAFPTIAVNRNNDALLGYSSFAATQHVSASYSFRFGSDAPGTMQPEQIFKFGEAPYFKDFGGGRNRWGDYSATVVDPLNDVDLWTIQEYASTSIGGIDRWGTWWSKVLLSAPPDGLLEVTISPPDGSIFRAGTSQPFTVAVFDSVPITNAVVFATMPGFFTNQLFFNNGQAPDLGANDNLYSLNVGLPATNAALELRVTVNAAGKTNAAGGTDINLTNYYTVATPPINDFFANSTKIPDNGGTVPGQNFFASTESGEPLQAGVASRANTIWWTWAPTNSGQVILDTLGSRFDTVLAVYSGNTLPNLAVIAEVNNITNPIGQILRSQAYLYFNATNGQAYRIAVGGATTNDFGPVQLRVEFDGRPDTNAPVVVVTNLLSGVLVSNLFTTNNVFPNPPSGLIVTNPAYVLSGTAIDPAPSASGVVQVQLTGNDGVPVMAFGTNNWSITNVLQPGTNLLQIVAVDLANNRSAPVTLSLTLRSFDPVNDVFANALQLTNFSGAMLTNTFRATFEQGEPNHAGKVGGKSAWYFFTAPADGLLFLTTTNSTFDTLLAVYSGNRVDQLTEVAANDDAGTNGVHSELTVAIYAGQTYQVAVDGLAGGAGQLVLQYTFTPTALFSLTTRAVGGGSIFPRSGPYPAGAVVTLTAVPQTGFGFATWQGDVISLEQPLTIAMTRNLSVTGLFLGRVLTDDFEAGGFRTNIGYTFSTTNSWIVQATNASETNVVLGGRYFARSGSTAHGQTNSVTLVAPTRAGGGSFSYRVSTERDFDFFEFHLNGVRLLNLSGESGWTSFAFNVPAGTNMLRWSYRKDPANISNLDAVFIDNLDLPLIEPLNLAVPVTFDTSTLRLAGGALRLRLNGQTNQVYLIQASPDLVNWQVIATNHAPFGIIEFQDAVTNRPSRYYRAVVP